MADGVKFIFKTLLKVPIFIFVSYLILNLFMFAYTYFRMLGMSYVVMQTAVENNYLPESEYKLLDNHLQSFAENTSHFVKNAKIITNAVGEPGRVSGIAGATGVSGKRQYGKPVRVGVQYQFTMIWPLMPHEYNPDSGTPQELNAMEAEYGGRQGGFNTVTIDYTVPGLKYYPDLDR